MTESDHPAPGRLNLGFWALVAVNFQTVLSYFAFMYALVYYILERFSVTPPSASGWRMGVTGAAFALPYLLLSRVAGGLSDRLSKRTVIVFTKLGELGVAAMGFGLLYWLGGAPSSLGEPYYWTAMGILFLFAVQGALYSPAKYGILAEIFPEARLPWANGVIELSSFAGLVCGLILGGSYYVSFNAGNAPLHQVCVGLAALALGGLALSTAIAKVAPAAPGEKLALRLLPDYEWVRAITKDRMVLISAVAISYYYAIGWIVLSNAPLWGQQGLGLSGSTVSGEPRGLSDVMASPFILVALVALGAGVGAWFAGSLQKRGVDIGFVPLGGLGASLCLFPLAFARAGMTAEGALMISSSAFLTIMLLFLFLAGVMGGFFIVPMNAMLQKRVAAPLRGGVIATTHFINFVAVAVAMGFYAVFIKFFHFTPSNIFAVIAIVTLFAMTYYVTIVPEALLALVTTVVTRFIYRMRIHGAENIPKTGAALLISNHVSIVDALLITAISPRPVRFLVWEDLWDHPALGYFLKIMRAIPVASDTRPRALIKSLSMAADALNNGELVCLFSEVQLTKPGLMLPVRRGFKHILTKAPAPVVPVWLAGVSQGIFRYERKKYRWRWPNRLRNQIIGVIGEPMSHDVSTHDIRQSVQGLSADCSLVKKEYMAPVHHRFIKFARSHMGLFCVADANTKHDSKGDDGPKNFIKTLTGAIVIARRMRKIWRDQEMIGILLPPSGAGVMVNIAAALAGKVIVNLNYTTGPDILRHCMNECGIKTVITSKLFLTRAKIEEPAGCLFLEDMMKNNPVKPIEKIIGLAAAVAMPIRALEKFCGAKKLPTPDTLFTIIFSSGSTGMPKGIMLTHHNIASNIESIDRAVSIWEDDKLIGFLPFFHSFGFTVALWGSLCIGFGAVHHPNPLEAKEIGNLVEKYGITIMVATPTFLQNYIRRTDAEKFQSLEYVLTGAEKLPKRIADAFHEKFGVVVHEGYGTTECSPVVSVNVDEYRSRGYYQLTTKRGTVGHPAPGVAVRITNVDTGEIMPGGQAGMIEVRGANIMRGYLNQPEKTAEVIKPGGWYVTGDMGFIDDDGFVQITDRLSRFSKIAGEMVPHMRIEDELHTAYGAADQTFAVAGVPDEAKGERLVVLHTADPERIKETLEKLTAAGLPNLWIPRVNSFHRVDLIPILGTGKLDLSRIKKMALEFSGAEKSESADA